MVNKNEIIIATLGFVAGVITDRVVSSITNKRKPKIADTLTENMKEGKDSGVSNSEDHSEDISEDIRLFSGQFDSPEEMKQLFDDIFKDCLPFFNSCLSTHVQESKTDGDTSDSQSNDDDSDEEDDECDPFDTLSYDKVSKLDPDCLSSSDIKTFIKYLAFIKFYNKNGDKIRSELADDIVEGFIDVVEQIWDDCCDKDKTSQQVIEAMEETIKFYKDDFASISGVEIPEELQ